MLAAGPDAITCDQIARGTPLVARRGMIAAGRPPAHKAVAVTDGRPAAARLPIILFQSLSAAAAAAAAASEAEKETRKIAV